MLALSDLDTLSVGLRTALVLGIGAITLVPLAIWLGTICGRSLSDLWSDHARFADERVKARLLNKET